MPYKVREIFYTLQGEGRNAGRAAVFCHFSGCNLWSGNQHDRARATCRFCDTDFIGTNGTGGGRYATANDLAQAIEGNWGGSGARRLVVLTGGEPLLQVDAALTNCLHSRGFEIAVETNGNQARPSGIDWLCVSPKAGGDLVLISGDKIKLVYPQAGAEPECFADLAFDHFILQPMDGPLRTANTAAAVAYCLAHPVWRLGVQTHKDLGIR